MADDKIKTLYTAEEVLADRLRRNSSGTFSAIDKIIEDQADALIRLGAFGSLQDFIVMRPINPSVVHMIILKLLKEPEPAPQGRRPSRL